MLPVRELTTETYAEEWYILVAVIETSLWSSGTDDKVVTNGYLKWLEPEIDELGNDNRENPRINSQFKLA